MNEVEEYERWPDPETGHLRVHARGRCVGEWCVIHKPMPGPWSPWPLHWRHDRGIMERICPCGVGHPAAEQLEHWDRVGQGWQATHGCCGCPCSPLAASRVEAANELTRISQELRLTEEPYSG